MAKLDQIISAVACWLATATGFLATFIATLAGLAIGALIGFSEGYTLAYNLALSITAIILAGLVLVAQNRDAQALQVKIDALIDASDARNDFLGIETEALDKIQAKKHELETRKPNERGTA